MWSKLSSISLATDTINNFVFKKKKNKNYKTTEKIHIKKKQKVEIC